MLTGGNMEITNFNSSSRESLIQSIAKIRSLETGAEVSPEAITDYTRINEQQFYAVNLYDGLKQVDVKIADKFAGYTAEALAKITESGIDFSSLIRASKRALNRLILAKDVKRTVARELRGFALGKSQLDSDRTKLSVSRLTDAADDTPLRTVKTALVKYEENAIASGEERAEFRKAMKAEKKEAKGALLKARKKKGVKNVRNVKRHKINVGKKGSKVRKR